MSIKWKIKELQFYGDSQLLIIQVNYKYQKNGDKITSYKKMVDIFKKYLIAITFEQIPRANNRVSNVMATIGSLLDIP
jgi:hypothetical protein